MQDLGHAVSVHNEVQLSFKLDDVTADGALFFTEDTSGSAHLLLCTRESRLEWQVRSVDDVTAVQSKAVLCDGCWYSVMASR